MSGMVAAMAGAVVTIAATFLEWWTFSGTTADAVFVGGETSTGFGLRVLGIIILVSAFMMFVRRAAGEGGRGWGWIAVVFAFFALTTALYSAVSPADAMAEFETSYLAMELDVSDERAADIMRTAVDEGLIRVSSKAGPYLATSGCLLAFAGAVSSIRRRKRSAAGGPQADPRFGLHTGSRHVP